jgi:YesN/AraC family two-component response regulator
MATKFLIFFLITISCIKSSGQNSQLYYKAWSAKNRLAINHFNIEKAIDSNQTCELVFLIKFSGEYHHRFAKDYLKQTVKNYMFDNSWIDTSYGITRQVKYLQAKFDLGEVYARLLRKELINREKLSKKICKQIVKKYLQSCKEQFKQFENETRFGKEQYKLDEWETSIRSQLDTLKKFEISEE